VSGVTSTAPKVKIGEHTTSGSKHRGRVNQPMTPSTTSDDSTAGSRTANAEGPSNSVQARIMYATIGGWS
jgi:hypothetical protein